MSPKQHIALVCQQNTRDTNSCCYEDYPENKKPVNGISRIVGEVSVLSGGGTTDLFNLTLKQLTDFLFATKWSASYDTLPVEKLNYVMQEIREEKEAPELNRKISKERRAFLRNFVEAQMVAFESKDVGASSGWFYWTMKTEGGAFAEWDFLRGVKEGWIPTIPDTSESSESVFGTCREIAQKTKDDVSIINEFPDPKHLDDSIWIGRELDDDYVVSHAGSLKVDTTKDKPNDHGDVDRKNGTEAKQRSWFPLFVVSFLVYGIWRVFFSNGNIVIGGRAQYTNLDQSRYQDQPASLTV